MVFSGAIGREAEERLEISGRVGVLGALDAVSAGRNTVLDRSYQLESREGGYRTFSEEGGLVLVPLIIEVSENADNFLLQLGKDWTRLQFVAVRQLRHRSQWGRGLPSQGNAANQPSLIGRL